MEESARAVLLTPHRSVLLMKARGATQHLWITPGGRREPAESPVQALAREIREETGLHGRFRQAPEIWIRHGTYMREGVERPETERFFLVRVEREFAPAPTSMGADEIDRFAGFRWWTAQEIAASNERFVPLELADLLSRLASEGPPSAPIVIDESAR